MLILWIVLTALVGVEKTIHEVEIYIGIFIGAVTFSGSVIAFGKLCGKIDGKPIMLPATSLVKSGLIDCNISGWEVYF